jgi:hypothetical protein
VLFFRSGFIPIEEWNRYSFLLSNQTKPLCQNSSVDSFQQTPETTINQVISFKLLLSLSLFASLIMQSPYRKNPALLPDDHNELDFQSLLDSFNRQRTNPFKVDTF